MIQGLYDFFKKWSDGGSIYILSDTHFADKDCHLMNPSWITPDEQIRIINKMVHRNDTLVLLGDIGKPEYVSKINTKRRVLISGNHDRLSDYRSLFSEIYDGSLFISPKILLSHEPVNGVPFCVNIHGHCHNGTMRYTDDFGCRHINVAADACGYAPINLSTEIKGGLVSDIKSQHRITIDTAVAKKIKEGITYED